MVSLSPCNTYLGQLACHCNTEVHQTVWPCQLLMWQLLKVVIVMLKICIMELSVMLN